MSIAARLAVLGSRNAALAGAPRAPSTTAPGFLSFVERPRSGAHVPVGSPAEVTGRLARLVPRSASIVRPPVAFDLETTGIGRDAVPFLVGLAGFASDGTRWLVQWELGDLDGERAMWAAMIDALGSLDPDTPLVTYNGASFDRPLVRTRLRRLGMWDASLEAWFGPRHHDLLPACRRLWRGALPDVRLVTLERAVLGAARYDDPDGAAIAAFGAAWISGARGDAIADRMAEIRRHNAWDLDGLLAIISAAAAIVDEPHDLAAAVRVAKHHARVGDHAGFEAVCERWSDAARRDRIHGPELLLPWADHLRRRGQPERAHAVLHAVCAVAPGNGEARTKLAIDFEHRLRRPDLALASIEDLVTACPLRLARLRRRIAGMAAPTSASSEASAATSTTATRASPPVREASSTASTIVRSPGGATVAASPTPAALACPPATAQTGAGSRPSTPRVPGSWRTPPSGPRRPLA